MVINGVTVKEPKLGGVSITDEPIWSSNTGRSSTGKMIGDIVARKATIEIAWPPLTFAEMASIRNAIIAGGEFFSITYPDPSISANVTKTVYCANIPRLLYSLSRNYPRYQDVTIQFIER